MGHRVVRVEPQGPTQLDRGLSHRALIDQGRAQLVANRGRIRLLPKGLMKLADRAIQITFLTQGHTEVGVEDCVVRSESGRLPELGRSAFRIATGFERDSEVVASG